MCFLRRSLPRTDQPKAWLNTSDLIHELTLRKQYARTDMQSMQTNPFTSEQLLEFEISDNDDSVERSLQEWKRLMHKLGVVNFNDDGVRKLLNSHRGEHPQSLHSDTILNLDEVAATLKGTEFASPASGAEPPALSPQERRWVSPPCRSGRVPTPQQASAIC